MWKFIAICLIVLVFLIAVSNAQVPINNPVKPKVGLSLAFGSKDGFGSEIACHFSNLAGGLESAFAISPKFDLMVNAGVDYLPAAELKGHDTSYSPDGETGNERDDYTYDDADKAINQPEFEMRLLIGLKYNF